MDETRKTQILLLKTKSSPTDSYEEYFSNPSSGQYSPVFVPVLEHKFNEASLKSLKTVIAGGAFRSPQENDALRERQYGGLIFTSQRAVEAFTKLIEELRNAGRKADDLFSDEIPIYVVGPATAKAIVALQLPCPVLGEESGNGDELASFILENHKPDRDLPVLFLVGEKRRDIIPKTLQSASNPRDRRIVVDEITVYETGVLENFAQHFANAIKPGSDESRKQWIVVFSPTGCKVMLQSLSLLDEHTGKAKREQQKSSRNVFVATIGPTTRNHLLKEFDFEADVCSQKPSPEGLGASIKDFEGG